MFKGVPSLKRLIVGLAVLCFSFGMGVFTKVALFGNSWVAAVPIVRVTEEENIENINQAVFRYQINHFTPVDTAVYYLSVANDSDPSAFTMTSLKNSNLAVRRLSELSTYPTTFSCYYCPDSETEFILRVGSARWLNEGEVLVGGSLRRWRGNQDQAYLFRVVRERTTWVVKEHELL